VRKPRVYIATSIESVQLYRLLRALLLEHEIHVTYDWTTHGRIDNASQLAEAGRREKQGVLDADVVVVLLPGGFGTHVELGLALAYEKPVVLCSLKPEFYGAALTNHTTLKTPPFYLDPLVRLCYELEKVPFFVKDAYVKLLREVGESYADQASEEVP